MADESRTMDASNRSVLVGEFMTKDVISLSPDEELQTAVNTLMAKHIKGAPVVNTEGELLGILTDDDLLVGNSRLHIPTMISILGEMTAWPPSILKFNHEMKKAASSTVGGAMSKDVEVLSTSDTLEDAATKLHEKGISVLPVVENKRVVGIVTRSDILRCLSGN
ncbi:MAG: CBS domain-containing protein [Acidimicrobiaceae bacterium]|nr:CBS domain-containing protein [Acidimicrobiaceae bacterium]